MTFLQPALLFALPAAALPVLIHLLNRLRYRSVKWAAMIFLLSATRSSTRRARLRHYLILLLRTLTILLLVLAASRPLTGGWLGAAVAGAPDTVIILLDRSASMEHVDPSTRISKRDHALRLFGQASAGASSASRFVLIENALLTPRAIVSLEALGDLPQTGPSDTAANIPAMLERALEYIIENRTGRTDIWVASDLQESNWQPASRKWPRLTAQLAALPQDTRIRLLALTGEAQNNTAVAYHALVRHATGTATNLDLVLDFSKTDAAPAGFPAILTANGVRTRHDLQMETTALRTRWTFAPGGSRDPAGWGKVETPADDNARDNVCFFVHDKGTHLSAAIVSDSLLDSRPLRLAVAPGDDPLLRSCEVVATDKTDGLRWEALALIVWQGAAPTGPTANRLRAFAESGGVVAFFCDGETSAAPPSPAPDPLFGIQWAAVETTPSDKPFRMALWEENDGPLARTLDGRDLPLPRLVVHQRRRALTPAELTPGAPAPEDATPGEWSALGWYVDGIPFLLKRQVGQGTVFLCTTLPRDDWSNLGDGFVLVPMLQRMLQLGGLRLAEAGVGVCGDWAPVARDEAWRCVDSDAPKDPRWDAGVYESGTRRVALNRPRIEDLPAVIDTPTVEECFGELDVSIVEELASKPAGALQSEVWPLFLVLAMLCMVTEARLLLAEYRRPTPAGVAPPDRHPGRPQT